MPAVGFEPTIPASEPPQTHALDSVATGIGHTHLTIAKSILIVAALLRYKGATNFFFYYIAAGLTN